jgi:hypothetical protein
MEAKSDHYEPNTSSAKQGPLVWRWIAVLLLAQLALDVIFSALLASLARLLLPEFSEPQMLVAVIGFGISLQLAILIVRGRISAADNIRVRHRLVLIYLTTQLVTLLTSPTSVHAFLAVAYPLFAHITLQTMLPEPDGEDTQN